MDRGEERRTANGWQSTVLESERTATALTCRPAAPFKLLEENDAHSCGVEMDRRNVMS